MTELAGLTSAEVGELAAAGALLAIPVGATEQHGPPGSGPRVARVIIAAFAPLVLEYGTGH